MREGKSNLRRSRRRIRFQIDNAKRGRPSPPPPPVNDDMLREILLRLPAHPSSLPRASAVCKHWRRVATDPHFIRRFRTHHRKPPILGAFVCSHEEIVFTPILDLPGHVPPERFSLAGYGCDSSNFCLLGYRHGLILVNDKHRKEVVVYDCIAGEQRRMAVPPEFHTRNIYGAVLRASGDPAHVHGGRHFMAVVVSISGRPAACVYSSETGMWGNVISPEALCAGYGACLASSPSTLVGAVLYWVLPQISHGILEFNLDAQSLDLIEGPPGTSDSHTHLIIQAEDGNVGLAAFSYPSFQIWRREVSCDGVVAIWLLQMTVDMHNVLRLPPLNERTWREVVILGYDEDDGVIFVYADRNSYMVKLKSMQPRKLGRTCCMNEYHPFTSFFIPGRGSAAAVFTEFIALDQFGSKYFYVT